MTNLDIQLRTFPGEVLKGQPGFFLLLIVKCERKEISGEKTDKQKGTILDDLKNVQPIQIANDAKINRFTVREMCTREKTKI